MKTYILLFAIVSLTACPSAFLKKTPSLEKQENASDKIQDEQDEHLRLETAQTHFEKGKALQKEALAGKTELMEEALLELNQAIKLNDNNAEYYFARAVVYREQKKWDLAISDLNKTLELDPKHYKSVFNKATVYEEMGQLDLALEYLQKSLDLNPDLAAAHYNMGLIYGQKGQKGKEETSYLNAIKLDGAMDVAHYNLGLLYLRQGRKEKALETLKYLQHLNSPYAQSLQQSIR